MAELKEQLEAALAELRKDKERKFDQTADLIINLQKFDVKKSQINLFVSVPFKVKDKKVCAFFEATNKNVDTITPEQFRKYNDKKDMKKVVKKYDFFVAQASVMPKVAATFGRVLGPAGKMPSPQMGILVNASDKDIEELKEKINNSVRIKAKESSIKLAVGKQSMKDSEISENAMAIYNAILKVLPKGIDNIKNVEIKFTMTKPKKVSVR